MSLVQSDVRMELEPDQFSDEELTLLALAADPDESLTVDAVPAPFLLDHGPLPMSYMPPTVPGAATRGRAAVALVLVAAFLAITALGFCVTYGQLLPA